MTLDQAKEFIVWLRDNGVQRCAFDGLDVALGQRVARPTDPLVVNDRADIEERVKQDTKGMFDG